MVVDVNGLKRINDRLGHIVGDSALLTFAGELSAAASSVPGSLAARLGGDEFCLLTVGADADEVVRLAEDVCRRADDVLDEGVACGVATTDELPAVGVTPSRLLRAADAAQYRAKRSSAQHPVVAGRTSTPTGHIADEREASERRRFRGRGSLEPGQLLDELMRRLDAADDRDSLSRLRVVAATVSETLDAASWWISSISPGDEHVVTRESGVVRRPGDVSADEYYEPDAYKLDDYPATYAALSGHCVLVDVDDPRSDPAETSLLMLGGHVGDGHVRRHGHRGPPLAGRGARRRPLGADAGLRLGAARRDRPRPPSLSPRAVSSRHAPRARRRGRPRHQRAAGAGPRP